MTPLLYQAFEKPSSSESETAFQRAEPYASLRKHAPLVPPRRRAAPATAPLRRRFGEEGTLKDVSEAIYQVSVSFDSKTQRAKIQQS
jgi:hypothetical protein